MRQGNAFLVKVSLNFSWFGLYKNGCCEDNVTMVNSKSQWSCLDIKTSIIEANLSGINTYFEYDNKN